MTHFYRVLYSLCHLRDWNAGLRTSYHHATPGVWIETWGKLQSVDPADYSLSTVTGTYTDAALSSFLESVTKHAGFGGWTQKEVKASGELNGLCAFDSPAGLVGWYEPTSFPAVIVEFEGQFTCSAPDSDSAVVARFSRETRRWKSLSQFMADFGL